MQMEIEFGQGKRIDAVFNGFRVSTDQPLRSGGDGSAPAPYEVFLSSLGTCAGIFVHSFCQSRKIPTEGLKMHLTFAFNARDHLVEEVNIQVRTPPDFPEKYPAGHCPGHRSMCRKKESGCAAAIYDRYYIIAVISKPPLVSKSGVGASCPILKILRVFLRLANSPRLDLERD